MDDFYKKTEPRLRDELPPQEQENFDNTIENNGELAADFEIYKKARRAVSSSLTNEEEAQRLQTTLDKLNQKYFSKTKAQAEEKKEQSGKVIPLRSKWFRLGIAAVSILLLLLAGNAFFKTEKISGLQLAEQFYAPKKTPATLGESHENDLLENAYQSYKVKNFPEAIRDFGAISPGHDRYIEAQLFLGYSHFENKSFGKAVAPFELVIKSKDSRYRENVEWHRVLALVAMDGYAEEAKIALEKILDEEGHAYFGDAGQVKEQLGW